MGDERPNVFSFGCGLALDYVGAVEHFGKNGVCYPIDECNWAIKKTENFKNFDPELPAKNLSFKEGMMLLDMTPKNAVVCFFHSLFTISRNTSELMTKLTSALRNKNNFYFVCNFTINHQFHMVVEERKFISEFSANLKDTFTLKHFNILGDRGIIISGKRK